MEENRITRHPLDTTEDSERESLQLYKALGQCSEDKRSIKDIVEKLNDE